MVGGPSRRGHPCHNWIRHSASRAAEAQDYRSRPKADGAKRQRRHPNGKGAAAMSVTEPDIEGMDGPDKLKSDSERTPDQIERDIEETRARMSRDMDELGQRLSPRNLKEE